MLVLSRTENREVVLHVGDRDDIVIRIRVAKIKGKHVRLGIIAPPSVSVFRREIDPSCGVETEEQRQ